MPMVLMAAICVVAMASNCSVVSEETWSEVMDKALAVPRDTICASVR